MAPKKPKNTKKTLPKVPKIPKDGSVKIIEITPRFFIIPALLIALIYIASPFVTGYMSDEKIEKNDTIGLNEIVALYNS